MERFLEVSGNKVYFTKYFTEQIWGTATFSIIHFCNTTVYTFTRQHGNIAYPIAVIKAPTTLKYLVAHKCIKLIHYIIILLILVLPHDFLNTDFQCSFLNKNFSSPTYQVSRNGFCSENHLLLTTMELI